MLSDLLLPQAVLPRVSGTKRQALATLAEATAAAAGVDPRAALDAVLLRERLAGTGLAAGVAVPHARMPGLERPVAGFARFDPPHDFDALDGLPADLALLLLTPADRGADHLKALARASRALRRADLRERLRAARTREELIEAFAERLESDAA